MTSRTYSAAEVAALLDHAIDWFYANRKHLIAQGMPAPVVPYGKMRFDRASIDAWIGRHHPHAPRREAANDQAPLQVPSTDSEWAAHLAQAYGASR